MIERWLRLVERRRLLVLIVVIAVAIALGAAAGGIRFDSSIEVFFLDDDPDLLGYRDFLDCFGTDETVVVLLEPDSISEAGFLDRLGDLDRTLLALEEVMSVRSLSSAPPETVPGLLVTEDGRGAAVLVELRPVVGAIELKATMLDLVRTEVRRIMPEVPFRVTGAAVVDETLYRYVLRDARRLLPAMAVALLVVLGGLFRSAWGVLLPSAVVAMAGAVTFGLSALLRWPANLLSSIVMTLVLAVGVADSVHVLSAYRRLRGEGHPPDSARRTALTRLFVPCLVTTLTTMAGMLSLTLTSLAALRQTGFAAALGTLVAFVLTFTFLPVALALLPRRALSQGPGRGERATLRFLGDLGWGHPRIVLAVAGLLLVLAAAGLPRLRVGFSVLGYFRDGDPVAADLIEVDERLAGTASVEFMVRAANGRTIADPALLEALDRASGMLSDREDVGRASPWRTAFSPWTGP